MSVHSVHLEEHDDQIREQRGERDVDNNRGREKAVAKQHLVEATYRPVGVYGWRKRCLYLLVMMLIAVIVINLGLTIWILVVLDFNIHGMGNLRITDTGIRLEGPAEFIGPLYAQNIEADPGSDLVLTSQQAIEMNAGNSTLHIDSTTVNITTELFQVCSLDGQEGPWLSVTRDSVTVGASLLEARGTLGITVQGPVETSQISSPPNEDLQLVAPSGSIDIVGAEGVRIEDGRAVSGGGEGGVEITSYGDLSISSETGSVILNSPNIVFPALPKSRQADMGGVYEVCACSSGQLYLVPATDDCQNDGNICSQ